MYPSLYLTFDFFLGPVDSYPILLLHLFCPPSYTRKSENVPAETRDSLRSWNAHRKHLALSFEKMVPPIFSAPKVEENQDSFEHFRCFMTVHMGCLWSQKFPIFQRQSHLLNLHDPSKWVLDEFSTCAPLKGCATKVMTSIPWVEEVAPPVALRYHAWWKVWMRLSTPGFGMSRHQNDRVTCIIMYPCFVATKRSKGWIKKVTVHDAALCYNDHYFSIAFQGILLSCSFHFQKGVILSFAPKTLCTRLGNAEKMVRKYTI